jgi:hypothetical protein
MLFSAVAAKTPTKISFFSKVFLLITFKVQLHQFSKKRSLKEVTKWYKSKFFLLFDLSKNPDLLDPCKVRTDPDLGGPKTYGSYRSGSKRLVKTKTACSTEDRLKMSVQEGG